MHRRGRKRVTFADGDIFQALKQKKDVSSHFQEYNSPRGEPKTSEYRSFRKIMEASSIKCHSNHHIGMGEVDRKNEGIALFDGNEDRMPPFHVKVAATRHAKFNTQTQHLKSPGTSYPSKGLFHKKRQEILKLTAEVLSINIDELASKSNDFITKLLRRLGTDGKTDKSKVMCQNTMLLESNRKAVRVTDPLWDAPYIEAQPKNLEETRRSGDLGTSVQYEDMFSVCDNKVRDVILSRPKYAENPSANLFSEVDMDLHGELDLWTDFEARDSSKEMKLELRARRQDDRFLLLPNTDEHLENTDPLLDTCWRGMLNEFDSKMDPGIEFAVGNHHSEDETLGLGNKKHAASLYLSNFSDELNPPNVTPYDCSGQSLRTCQWPRLLEVEEFAGFNEISEYEEQGEIKLLGWKENVTNDVPCTSELFIEKTANQLPLTLYQGHDSSSILSYQNMMERFSCESKHGPFMISNYFENFQEESYHSLDSVLLQQWDLPLEWRSSPFISHQKTSPWPLPGHFSRHGLDKCI